MFPAVFKLKSFESVVQFFIRYQIVFAKRLPVLLSISQLLKKGRKLLENYVLRAFIAIGSKKNL